MNRIKKLSKKTKLDETAIKDIIIINHTLNNLIAPKQLKKVDLELSMDVIKFIKNVAKILKVDEDSVLSYFIAEYLKAEKK